MKARRSAVPDPITMATLSPLPHWVAWRNEEGANGKWTKVPYSPLGGKAAADKPKTWGCRAQAEAMASTLLAAGSEGGVGIELSPIDETRGLGGVDLDTCRDLATGEIEDWANDIIARFASYTEVSPSGTGVKVFFTYSSADLATLRGAMGSAQWGKQFKRCGGEHPPAIELYLGNRYFAVTEERLPDSPTEWRHVERELLLEVIQTVGPRFAEDADHSDPTRQSDRASHDDSRSSRAFRSGKELRRAGATFEEMVAALLADDDPEVSAWTREKGEANGQRELHRIWDKAAAQSQVIQIVAGKLHETVTAAEDALVASDIPIYQRGDSLVRPVRHKLPAAAGQIVPTAKLCELDVFSMVDSMSKTARYEKYDARTKGFVPTDPPPAVAQILLGRNGSWSFPPIRGVITTPTIRPDGSLLTAPGYDPATRLYHFADPALLLDPSVAAPTRQGAEQALQLLAGLLTGFPFKEKKSADQSPLEVSLAVALSGLITPVIRGALPVAPLIAVNAHAPGSGKTYYVALASMIATGRECSVISVAKDEAETEKRIVGLLLAGLPILCIDNCNGELGGDLLCQAIERPLIRVRRLGASDIIEIENSATVFATGNNLRVRGDMVRRSLVLELDPEVERPELRSFAIDPVALVQADRGKYVSACLVIVSAYVAAGMPGKLAPIGSFEMWSDFVRSALVWLGCADPALSMEAARDADPELGELSGMINAWGAAFADTPTSCRAAIETATRNSQSADADFTSDDVPATELRFPQLNEAITLVASVRGVPDPTKLGRWLLAREGRIVDNRRFRKDGTSHGSARWKLESMRDKGGWGVRGITPTQRENLSDGNARIADTTI